MDMKEPEELMLIEVLSGGADGAIERQEARGQSKLCHSQNLSTSMKCGYDSPNKDAKEVLESWGFQVGEPIDGDEIFTSCVFPEGWSIKPTDHHMWNDLVDDKGRKRGAMFYKAAFYDRSTNLTLNTRFHVSKWYPEDYNEKVNYCLFQVIDCDDTVVFESEKHPIPEIWNDHEKVRVLPKDEHKIVVDAFYAAEENAKKECLEWLEEKYPDWQDETKYWNEEVVSHG